MPDQRESLEAQLRERGQRRRESLASAHEELDAIAELLPHAMAAGIKKVELAQLTGLSRPTINALLERER